MRKALIIVDMQNDFILPEGKLTLSSKTEDTTKKLREDITKLAQSFVEYPDSIVFCTLDTHAENDCEFGAFPPHCIKGTHGWEVVDEIKEAIKDVRLPYVEKKSFTQNIGVFVERCFSNMPIDITVVGVVSHICVHAICADIVNHCKNTRNIVPSVTVIKDLCMDFDPEMEAFAFKHLASVYGVKVV